MNRQELVDALESTLDDFRLSRSEKHALKALFADHASSAHDLSTLRSEAFELARRKLTPTNSQDVLAWLEEISKLLVVRNEDKDESVDSQAVFSTQEDCIKILQGILSTCRHSIDVCVFTITDDRITNALMDAYKRKVKLRIISDDEKAADRGSDIFRMKQAGVEVRTDRDPNHMHHKFAIFDNNRLLNGSYNWTRSAAHNNEENFVITNESKLLREFGSQFERMWHLFG